MYTPTIPRLFKTRTGGSRSRANGYGQLPQRVLAGLDDEVAVQTKRTR